MINIPTFSYQDLNEFSLSCEKELIVNEPYLFYYPNELKHNEVDNWDTYILTIKEKNEYILSQLRHKANVYALYKRDYNDTKWRLIYVGERKSAGMRERVTHNI